MKQNSIKMYAQALCCALAVCSASNFACGMDIMDVRQENVKDISAETAISCMQDIDKAASIVWELNKQMSISERDVYAAFEKVGIPQDEVILDPSDLTVPPSGTSFVWISEGRISTLAMYLCSNADYLNLTFENKFKNSIQYDFDPDERKWTNSSNYDICLTFLYMIKNIFRLGGYNEYLRLYFNTLRNEDVVDRKLSSSEIVQDLWKKWAKVCEDKKHDIEERFNYL